MRRGRAGFPGPVFLCLGLYSYLPSTGSLPPRWLPSAASLSITVAITSASTSANAPIFLHIHPFPHSFATLDSNAHTTNKNRWDLALRRENLALGHVTSWFRYSACVCVCCACIPIVGVGSLNFLPLNARRVSKQHAQYAFQHRDTTRSLACLDRSVGT